MCTHWMISQPHRGVFFSALSFYSVHFLVHDAANNNDDTAVDNTMTRSETKLDSPVFEDPLFHSMSVIEGSERT